MTNDETVILRCWIRGADEHIQDESQLSQTDYVSCPKYLMDEDSLAKRLTKANFKFEEIKSSKTGLAWNAYRVGYKEDYLQETVGLTI